MWISNTATAAMMLPLVLGLLGQLKQNNQERIWTFALLGVALLRQHRWHRHLVGSPPNAIAAAQTGMSFY